LTVGRLAVVSVGGNSLIKEGQTGTLPEQFENARETSKEIAKIIADGWRVAITHGNGPQVGNLLLRSDLAKRFGNMPIIPLDICGADTQGAIGYMLQQGLKNELDRLGIQRPVISVVTQVLVDKDDSAFGNPTKPIGPFFSKEKAEEYRSREGWAIMEDSKRGYRRVVPSPKPRKIIELDSIKTLVELGYIVIAVGGGGVPVVQDERGCLRGVEAVIDKDYSSSLLATALKADLFLISTSVERVALNYKKPNQRNLDHVTLKEAKTYLEQAHFPPGSMGPKIEAIIDYLEKDGKEAIITSPQNAVKAIEREAGTRFTVQL
jgi:carbamate kinase